MKILSWLVVYLVLGTVSFTILVQSQDPDFISIDCGISEDGGYDDDITSLHYTSDTKLIDTGITMGISPQYNFATLPKQFATVRTFPQNIKSCYILRPQLGKAGNYLIRASFMYGNYDSLDSPPEFDLHIGVDLWDTVKFTNASIIMLKEIIHTPSTDYLYVCLANTGSGTPFISALELRPLDAALYPRDYGSLVLVERLYMDQIGSAKVRYPEDLYDRIWDPKHFTSDALLASLNSTSMVEPGEYQLPQVVLENAETPLGGREVLNLKWIPLDPDSEFYIIMHFAELQQLQSNQTRLFNITLNDKYLFGPFSPAYLKSTPVKSTKPLSGSTLSFNLVKAENSTLPPLLNAVELYAIMRPSLLPTKQSDIDAVANIKSIYGITKNWQGDPCNPKAYLWVGVECSFRNNTPPSIISLNLTSNGLKGDIAASFSNLTSIVVLDLSNNRLTGKIPESFANLPFLTSLNLSGNQLSGSVPQKLQDKANKGVLLLSLHDNPGLCQSETCTKKKKTGIVVIVASVTLSIIFFVASAATWRFFSRTSKGQTKHHDTRQRKSAKRKGVILHFTYDELTQVTGGFQKQIGKGAVGRVYEGFLDNGTRVAVKMLSLSKDASEQFETEVELLISIRHKNLVSLIGYCEEGTDLALIYEYMAKGDLKDVLSASDTLSWKRRLQIAIDAAQGLDYLHTGCRPPIVHRDVKSANILLDENLQAKIADFGLSKIFPTADREYVSTRVIGTLGYLDQEYHLTGQLTEKIDVYSFGVVLLELITGQDAIIKTNVNAIALVQWVQSNKDDIWSIVDPRIQEDLNPKHVLRVTKVAMACVKPNGTSRPTMRQVVTDLHECLAMEDEEKEGLVSATDNMSSMAPTSSTTMSAR